jgi:hypothetical protein
LDDGDYEPFKMGDVDEGDEEESFTMDRGAELAKEKPVTKGQLKDFIYDCWAIPNGQVVLAQKVFPIIENKYPYNKDLTPAQIVDILKSLKIENPKNRNDEIRNENLDDLISHIQAFGDFVKKMPKSRTEIDWKGVNGKTGVGVRFAKLTQGADSAVSGEAHLLVDIQEWLEGEMSDYIIGGSFQFSKLLKSELLKNYLIYKFGVGYEAESEKINEVEAMFNKIWTGMELTYLIDLKTGDSISIGALIERGFGDAAVVSVRNNVTETETEIKTEKITTYNVPLSWFYQAYLKVRKGGIELKAGVGYGFGETEGGEREDTTEFSLAIQAFLNEMFPNKSKYTPDSVRFEATSGDNGSSFSFSLSWFVDWLKGGKSPRKSTNNSPSIKVRSSVAEYLLGNSAASMGRLGVDRIDITERVTEVEKKPEPEPEPVIEQPEPEPEPITFGTEIQDVQISDLTNLGFKVSADVIEGEIVNYLLFSEKPSIDADGNLVGDPVATNREGKFTKSFRTKGVDTFWVVVRARGVDSEGKTRIVYSDPIRVRAAAEASSGGGGGAAPETPASLIGSTTSTPTAGAAGNQVMATLNYDKAFTGTITAVADDGSNIPVTVTDNGGGSYTVEGDLSGIPAGSVTDFTITANGDTVNGGIN